MTVSSACAWSRVTPGRNRPMPKSVLPQLAVSGVSGKGVMSSISLPGEKMESKSKVRGSTPMIAVGLLLSVIERPTTAGSPPKRRCQKV